VSLYADPNIGLFYGAVILSIQMSGVRGALPQGQRGGSPLRAIALSVLPRALGRSL